MIIPPLILLLMSVIPLFGKKYMCVMSYCNKRITNYGWLYNSYLRNNHGLGFCYADQGKLFVEKGYFNFDEFLDAYNQIPDVPNIFHARDSSGGAINEQMCHPFNVSENLAFAHNGMLRRIKEDITCSDTYNFNELLLKPSFANDHEVLFTEPCIKENLEDYIEYTNKLIFLDNKGRNLIVNEKAGIWERNTVDGDIWWSNNDYLIDTPKYFKHNDGFAVKLPRPDTSHLQNLGEKKKGEITIDKNSSINDLFLEGINRMCQDI